MEVNCQIPYIMFSFQNTQESSFVHSKGSISFDSLIPCTAFIAFYFQLGFLCDKMTLLKNSNIETMQSELNFRYL